MCRVSRLIDADKLQKDLEKVKKQSETFTDILCIIEFQIVVDTQPTVYIEETKQDVINSKKVWFNEKTKTDKIIYTRYRNI